MMPPDSPNASRKAKRHKTSHGVKPQEVVKDSRAAYCSALARNAVKMPLGTEEDVAAGDRGGREAVFLQ